MKLVAPWITPHHLLWGLEVMQISGLTGSFLASDPSRQTRAYLHCHIRVVLWSPVPLLTTECTCSFAGPVWQATLILQPHGLLQVQDVTEASTPQTLLQASLQSVRVTPGHHHNCQAGCGLPLYGFRLQNCQLIPWYPTQRSIPQQKTLSFKTSLAGLGVCMVLRHVLLLGPVQVARAGATDFIIAGSSTGIPQSTSTLGNLQPGISTQTQEQQQQEQGYVLLKCSSTQQAQQVWDTLQQQGKQAKQQEQLCQQQQTDQKPGGVGVEQVSVSWVLAFWQLPQGVSKVACE